jgi:hypothetical protein
MRNCYADRKLKLIIGSLGINGWFEYGGKTWGESEFMRKASGISSDSHCWLEDEGGNVYDCLFPQYNFWVKLRTGSEMKLSGILEGVSKAKLATMGIDYVPAPKDAQTALFCFHHKFVKDMYEGLKTHKYVFSGDHIVRTVWETITRLFW